MKRGKAENETVFRAKIITRFFTVLAAAVFLCGIVVLAVFLRLPHCPGSLNGYPPEAKLNQTGLPYYIEADGYYHARIASEIAENGSFGLTEKDGCPWDPVSFAPEGRSADYPDGLSRVTVWIWKFLNLFQKTDLYTVGYGIGCFFLAVTALLVLLLARRVAAGMHAGIYGNSASTMSWVSGVVAATLVVCAPSYVERTLAGTFDTDLVQTPFALLLFLLTIQMLTSKSYIKCVVYAASAAVTAALFTKFWTGSPAFIIVAILGGLCFLIGNFICAGAEGAKSSMEQSMEGNRGQQKPGFRRPAFLGWLLMTALTVILVMILQGAEYLKQFFQSAASLSSDFSADHLPNLLDSVAELKAVSFFPQNFSEWITGGEQNQMTVVTGIGGIVVFVFAAIGLGLLVVVFCKQRKAQFPCKTVGACLAVFIVWTAASLIGLRYGIRSVEHFSAPMGVLAGVAAGALAEAIFRSIRQASIRQASIRQASIRQASIRQASIRQVNRGHTNSQRARGRLRIYRAAVLIVVFCALLVCPSVFASYQIYKTPHGPISDAYETAADWIKTHAVSSEAMIISWWDAGYYYEYQTGLPVLWDGGSLDSLRAMAVGKALTTQDPALSAAIFRMLAGSGNRAMELFMDKLGAADGSALLWKLLSMSSAESQEMLKKNYGFTPEEADVADGLLHPAIPDEVYLVLTSKMMHTLGWIEYYGNWDFTGMNTRPVYVDYTRLPDGSADIYTASETQIDFFKKREQEIIWRLFVNGDGDDGDEELFRPVFEAEDPYETVQVWQLR